MAGFSSAACSRDCETTKANLWSGIEQQSPKDLGATQEPGRGTLEHQPTDGNEAPERQERDGDARRGTNVMSLPSPQVGDEGGQFLREQTRRRPNLSLATATGSGYVLGGGVGSRLTAPYSALVADSPYGGSRFTRPEGARRDESYEVSESVRSLGVNLAKITQRSQRISRGKGWSRRPASLLASR